MLGMWNKLQGQYPFTKATPSPKDHFWISPLGGRITDFLLYF